MNEMILERESTLSKSIYGGVKRLFDFTLALFFLIILSPILLMVYIAIKLDSKGPAIFKQERSGKGNTKFIMCKFRSMPYGNNVYDTSVKDMPTRVGKIIRKTSLDELPQLFNILKGEMSFIGPRPWVTKYAECFNENQMHRLDVLPGITGLAQCSGRNDLDIVDKINLDLEYVNNISLQMDIKVIVKTILSVIKAEGATTSNKDTVKNEIDTLKKMNNK